MTETRDQDWVTILDAAVSSKVPATTIREWYRNNEIKTMTTSDGVRLVSLPEVKAYARGEGQHHRGDPNGRMTRSPAQLQTDGEGEVTRRQGVTELQGIARDRTDTA